MRILPKHLVFQISVQPSKITTIAVVIWICLKKHDPADPPFDHGYYLRTHLQVHVIHPSNSTQYESGSRSRHRRSHWQTLVKYQINRLYVRNHQVRFPAGSYGQMEDATAPCSSMI